MASLLGALKVTMALESAQFIAGLRNATNAANSSATSINKAMGLIKGGVGTLAAAFSIDFLAGQIQSAFDYADAIQDLSDRTGASTDFIQKFGYAAQLSGSSVENSRAGIEKFSKTLGAAQLGNKAAEASMAKFGVTSRVTDTAVRQAADGIAKLKSPAEQAAATTELFGKKQQDLVATLAGGSAALDDFGQRAADLGIVLDSGLIANAGKVNDQLDTLKMIVTAELANVIVQNANSIQALALGVTNMVVALAKFWAQDPAKAMAIMGAITGAIGGFMVGGPMGALVGGTAGAIIGYKVGHDAQQSRFEQSTEWKQQNAAETASTRAEQRATQDGRPASVIKHFQDQKLRHRARRQQLENGITNGSINPNAVTSHTPKVVDTRGNLPTPRGTPAKKPSGPTAEELAKKEADRVFAFQSDLSRQDSELIQAKENLTSSVSEQSDYERQLLDKDHADRANEIARAITDGKVKDTPTGKNADGSATEAEQLRIIEDQIYTQKQTLISQKESEELAKQENDLKSASITNESDLLNGSAALARSAKERRDIALRLVDLQFQQEKIALDAVIASKTSTDTEKKIAQARLDILDTLKGQALKQATESNQGPMQQYLAAIPRTSQEINEQMESVSSEGLDNLKSGLLDVIKGTGSVKDAFASMAGSIIDGLIKIALEQAIIKPLGSLLFGGTSGGSGLLGGLFSSIVSGITGTAAASTSSLSSFSNFSASSFTSGARANGGLTRAGDYLVGERGPEMVSIGNTANVTTTRDLKTDKPSGGMTVNFGDITSNDPAAIKAAAFEAVAQAMPMITKQSTDATIAKLNRRGL